MNVEQEINEMKLRIDRLEIRASERDIKDEKTDLMMRQLLNYARIQTEVATKMEVSIDSLRGRMDILESEFKKLTREVNHKFDSIIDYLKNPPKNGH